MDVQINVNFNKILNAVLLINKLNVGIFKN